jgi:purine nucleosidase
MGGAFHTPGNATPAAEANIFSDPVAADLVFGADWAVTAVPLNLTRQTVMTRETLTGLASTGGWAMQMVADLSQGYIDFCRGRGAEGMLVHDCCAAVCLTDPDLFAQQTGTVRVVVGGIASGQTIQRPNGMGFAPGDWDGRRSQSVCYDGKPDEILSRIRQACRAEFEST